MLLRIVLQGFCISLALRECFGYTCYSCRNTTYPCTTTVNCGENVGCLNHVHTQKVTGQQRFYSRGCAIGDCTSQENTYCLRASNAECCIGNLCNNYDTLDTWKPRQPFPISILQTTSTTATISWPQRCHNLYSYFVHYYIHSIAFGKPVFNYDQNTGQMMIESLFPLTAYTFVLWAYMEGEWSDPAFFSIRTLAADSGTNPGNTRSCWQKTTTDDSPGTIQICSSTSDVCYGRLNYKKPGEKPYITSGCQSSNLCSDEERNNNANCDPGVEEKYCHFCCNSTSCNSQSWATTFFSCSSVTDSSSVDCSGGSTIEEVPCLLKGCCYDSTRATKCFYPGRDSTSTTTTNGPVRVAFSTGIIIAIVFAIIILIILIILIVWFCNKRRRKQQKGSYDVPSRTARGLAARSVSRDIYDRTRIGES